MTTRVARPLDYILQIVQKKRNEGVYTVDVINFKLVDNAWYISYGVMNTITGAADMSKYEEFDITHHIPYVKDTLYRYGF